MQYHFRKIVWGARCICGWPGEPNKVLGITASTSEEAATEAKKLHDHYWQNDSPGVANQFVCKPTVLPIK
ncbi:MAG: hypothetical protein COU51_01835 [Parcubacteria group bacterium CG10_big_fil_rev_8_21_14_0_10_36_14]|nr:MAG: hypothetical protein COU51_01835 [Parcubacteria group bacterium CG10_big_fil_rev_8_21_14_0_10_36_14]